MSRPARDRAAQQPPPTTLAGFPSVVRPRRRLWRAGRSVQANPWWFDGSGAGRFDPIGTGQASCYLGTDRLAGLLEVLGPEMSGGAVHVDDLTARSLYPLDPAQLPTPIANLAHRRATGYGVTNELSTMTPYRCPQQWATALLEAGFWGLRLPHPLRSRPQCPRPRRVRTDRPQPLDLAGSPDPNARSDVAPATVAELRDHHHRHPTVEHAARRASTLNPLSAASCIAVP